MNEKGKSDMSFHGWLINNDSLEWATIRQYAVDRPQSLSLVKSLNDALAAVQQDATLDSNLRASLLEQLPNAWQAYQNSEVTDPPAIINAGQVNDAKTPNLRATVRSFFELIWANFSSILLAAIALIAIFVLWTVLWPGSPLLTSLGDVEVARGLITFVFAFGVIFVTLILLVSLLASSNHTEIIERFNAGKELFTAMIAVLGTILGFYFGQAGQQQNPLENILATEDSVLLGMALLGVPVVGLDLTPEQISQIDAVLDTNQEPQEKVSVIEGIIRPPVTGQSAPVEESSVTD